METNQWFSCALQDLIFYQRNICSVCVRNCTHGVTQNLSIAAYGLGERGKEGVNAFDFLNNSIFLILCVTHASHDQETDGK